MKICLLALFLIGSSLAKAAPCAAPKFTSESEVKLTGDTALIVTHPSTLWDGRYSSKAGMDAAVQYAKKRNFPVVYLQGTQASETYFFSDCAPTYWVASQGGEFSFAVPVSHIISVGGHWELCQKTTQQRLMEAWSAMNVDLTFTEVMDGLYTYGEKFLRTDSYYEDFVRFMGIIYYGNPRNYWYGKKLSLLESMGIVRDPAQQVEFLKRNLPPFERLNKNYEVQLWVNGKNIETLQKSPVQKPPVFKIEFVNSLYESGVEPAE